MNFIKLFFHSITVARKFETQMKAFSGNIKKVKAYRVKLTKGQLELLTHLASFGVCSIADLKERDSFASAVVFPTRTFADHQAFLFGLERKENESDVNLMKRINLKKGCI